jgi:hypothetical protein
MKIPFFVLNVLSLGIFTLTSGCSTETPGAHYTLGAYSTNVDSTPDKVTAAAAKAADDLQLLNIASSGTKVDGTVSAQNANGDKIVITIAQSGDNVSSVSIRVGTTGDEAVSKELVDHIKSHLTWF